MRPHSAVKSLPVCVLDFYFIFIFKHLHTNMQVANCLGIGVLLLFSAQGIWMRTTSYIKSGFSHSETNDILYIVPDANKHN